MSTHYIIYIILNKGITNGILELNKNKHSICISGVSGLEKSSSVIASLLELKETIEKTTKTKVNIYSISEIEDIREVTDQQDSISILVFEDFDFLNPDGKSTTRKNILTLLQGNYVPVSLRARNKNILIPTNWYKVFITNDKLCNMLKPLRKEYINRSQEYCVYDKATSFTEDHELRIQGDSKKNGAVEYNFKNIVKVKKK